MIGKEIERKFLVKNKYLADIIRSAKSKERIIQGYLCTEPESSVRIRIKGDKGFISVKGEASQSGLSRLEWEMEIPYKDAFQMLELSKYNVISKIRHIVYFKEQLFEVDIFEGNNLGLIMAEIELSSEKDSVELPDWIHKEVTGDIRYYNSYLAKMPYSKW